MSRTIGHNCNRWGSAKKNVQAECNMKMRHANRQLCSKVRRGVIDCENIAWPHKYTTSNWWNWD